MAATDLFLRSKVKVRTTDLWLHTAGADGGIPPTVQDSGTLVTLTFLAALEALADENTTPVAVLTQSQESHAATATLPTSAALSARETAFETNTLPISVLLDGLIIEPPIGQVEGVGTNTTVEGSPR